MPSPCQPQSSREGQALKLFIKQMGMGQKQGVGWQPWDWRVLRIWPVGWQLLASRPPRWHPVLEETILKFVILEQRWHGVEEEIVVQPLVSMVCVPSFGYFSLWFPDPKLKLLQSCLNSKSLVAFSSLKCLYRLSSRWCHASRMFSFLLFLSNPIGTSH